jgi:ribonuclease T1
MFRWPLAWLLAPALFGAALLFAPAAHARGPTHEEIAAAALPAEAREVLSQIRAGGPFRYERDGVVFGNREHQLPSEKHGYYHEYTVPTPGVKTRGARRIVCGGPKREPEACFYTGDHYRTFARIRE